MRFLDTCVPGHTRLGRLKPATWMKPGGPVVLKLVKRCVLSKLSKSITLTVQFLKSLMFLFFILKCNEEMFQNKL